MRVPPDVVEDRDAGWSHELTNRARATPAHAAVRAVGLAEIRTVGLVSALRLRNDAGPHAAGAHEWSLTVEVPADPRRVSRRRLKLRLAKVGVGVPLRVRMGCA